MVRVRESGDGVTFALRVLPRSGKNEIAGEQDEALRLRLTAPPVEGMANKLCREFIAGLCGVSQSRVELVAGQKGRNKVIRVIGISKADLALILSRHGVSVE